jgi:hypothetical protein
MIKSLTMGLRRPGLKRAGLGDLVIGVGMRD